MEWFNFAVSLIGSIGACATAYLMFLQYTMHKPSLDVYVRDIPGCEQRGTEAEKLQLDGFFLLDIQIELEAADDNRVLKSIKIDGAQIPGSLVNSDGRWIGGSLAEMHHGKIKTRFKVTHKPTRISLIFKPDNREQGDLLLRTGWDRLTEVDASFSYKRTHFFGSPD
jgi:hypothetical protein